MKTEKHKKTGLFEPEKKTEFSRQNLRDRSIETEKKTELSKQGKKDRTLKTALKTKFLGQNFYDLHYTREKEKKRQKTKGNILSNPTKWSDDHLIAFHK